MLTKEGNDFPLLYFFFYLLMYHTICFWLRKQGTSSLEQNIQSSNLFVKSTSQLRKSSHISFLSLALCQNNRLRICNLLRVSSFTSSNFSMEISIYWTRLIRKVQNLTITPLLHALNMMFTKLFQKHGGKKVS